MSTTVPIPAPAPTSPARRGPIRLAFVVSLVLLIGAAAGLSAAVSGLNWYTKKLPIQGAHACHWISPEVSSWGRAGSDVTMTPEILETLGTKNYVQRAMIQTRPAEGKAARIVDFHLAYYTGMIDTVPHVPDRCFVTGGDQLAGGPWDVRVPLKTSEFFEDPAASADMQLATGEKDVKILTIAAGPGARSPVRASDRIRLPRGIENLQLRAFSFKRAGVAEPLFAGYFFIANGGLTPSAQGVRLLSFDLRSDYAYYMKVQFTAANLSGPEELAELAGSLLDELLPDIMQCVPDWTEVIRGNYPADNPRRKQSPLP